MNRMYLSVPLLLLPTAVWAGAGALPSLVQDIGVCLLLSGFIALAFTRIRLPEIAAFLVAGIIAGPIGLEWVTDPENIDTIAQFGLILLLFLVGLELDIKKLIRSGRTLLISGAIQYPLCLGLGFLLVKGLLWIGIGSSVLDSSPYFALYTGLVIAASSTLLVVKYFHEHLELDTKAGRISLGLLIFQDFWAILIIALQPNIGDPQLSPIVHTFAGIALLVLVSALAARLMMPTAFRWIAKLPELILVVALGWCFLVVLTGINLDIAVHAVFDLQHPLAVGASMGALIAGASIATLPYSMEVLGKVGVVKDFFVTLFFVGLGMSIPVPGAATIGLAIFFVLLTFAARFLPFFPLLYFTGLDRRNASIVSTRMAQVSEFSLVLGFLGVQAGHISAELNSSIIFAFVLTSILTPILYTKADAIHNWISPLLTRLGFSEPSTSTEASGKSYDLALLGVHRVAATLLYEIETEKPELLKRILVVDFNVSIHKHISQLGVDVRYGDLSNAQTLQHSGLDRARVIACTIPNDMLKGISNKRLVRSIRLICPKAQIIANAVDMEESRQLYEAGADYVYFPQRETADGVAIAIEKAMNGELASLDLRTDTNHAWDLHH